MTLSPGAINYDGSSLDPGDVVCLDAGNYSSLRFYNFTGASGYPIIICNVNGLAHMNDDTDTVDLDDCQYIEFAGDGHGGLPYGIKLIRRLRIRDHSKYITLKYLESYNDDVSISIINNDDRTDFQNFLIHNNYLHDIQDEGMYIGNATASNFIKYVEVYSNLLETIGEGIQIGWTEGYCKIHHNYITDVNTLDAVDPCYAAISTAADCDPFEIYANTIIDSDYRGISIQDGQGEVYNNLVVNVGHGVTGSSIRNFTDYVKMYNNTLITATDYGIDCSSGPSHNEGWNNIILDTTNDPIDYGGSPEENFHHNHTKDGGYTPANYYFVDWENDDYHLTSDSPGVNAGDDTEYPDDDLDGIARPQGSAPDIGAFEYILVPAALVSQIQWSELTPNADELLPATMWGIGDLSAGLTYILKIQAYNSTTGTLTIEGTATETHFLIALLNKALLE